MRNKFAVVWIWLFLLPLAFDFKAAETASKAIQILLTVPSIGAAIALMLIGPRFAYRSRLRTVITSLFMLTMVGSIATQVLQGNDSGNYMRVILPFLLMLLGYFVACRPWDSQRLEQIERAMYWSMIASLVFSFAYGMATGGGLDSVRFRIVSVTFLCLQGLLLHEFVIARRVTKFTALLFLGTVVIELLSVTRSLLVGTILLFIYATWLAAPSIRHLFTAGLRAVMIAALLGAMVAASAAFFPSVAEHWAQRMSFSKDTESGRDPTTITRLAEMKDQYDQTMASPLSVAVGLGYGHDYRYSPTYLPDLAGQMTKKDFYAIKEWAAGHNFWVYQFFAGGIMFGIALPIALLWALYRGSMAYRAWKHRAPDVMYLPVLGRALLVVASLPATSVGGNPLGNRFSGIVFGVALGLLVAAYARIAHALRTRATETAAPRPSFRSPFGPVHPDMQPFFEPTPDALPTHASHAPGLTHGHHDDGRRDSPPGASTFAPSA
ncbi:hypothetical protein [Caballeronia sp. GAWG1-1]|uniref:hypothetical protein n=1 Tax=Caballeronia sp. GAWG1-1 TaxID=2921742 RepID=UPI0020291442|nr:hypothetical protein [Caballeronia sp. GAWG1-1]